MTEPGAPPEPITRDCKLDLGWMWTQIYWLQAYLKQMYGERKKG